VRELSQLRPARVVRDVVACWSVIVASWAAAALWPGFWIVALAVPLIGSRYYALFIIGHDGLHRRLFQRQAVNDAFCDLLVLGPVGGITHITNANHLAHHRHLASELDPDRYKHGCFNKTTSFEFVAFLTGLSSLVRAAGNAFLGRAAARTSGASTEAYRARDLVILGSWQVALAVGLSLGVGWWGYPLLWLVPVYLFTYLPDLIRSFVEHSHPEADAQADEHRLITYRSNPIERMLLAPMNMNLHAAHHLWTSIPYYNLPAADRELKDSPAAAGLVWRGSYLRYLLRYYLALPLPECRRAGSAA
jgi:fatty acid desaturase